MVNAEHQTAQADMPRTDRQLDLVWWTRKLFEELVFSDYGMFDDRNAIENICKRYNVTEPTDDESFWQLQHRLVDVAGYDEYDFVGGDLEEIIQRMTRFDDELAQGEQ